MEPASPQGELEQIPVGSIRPNPDNPRLNFRQSELDELQESIRIYGVQVPIAVYREKAHYVLIDGERRWRCASKLNRKTIPALVQEKPSPLQNLLLMFNIHSLREQWDYLTIAMKLPQVISLLRSESGHSPTEAEISSKTGLTRGQIRRCKLLIEIPKKYKLKLLAELKKPKSKQRLSEDLLIEMERALKTVSRAMPDAVQDKDAARDALLEKYDKGLIKTVVDFRKVAKIARAEKMGADSAAAERAISRLVSDPGYTIDQAFEDTVSGAYAERDIVSRIEALIARLESAPEEAIDEDVREKLQELIERASKVLEGGQ
jgi:ParB family transcriptional regulator, chromosome partitioning protein